MKLLIVAENRLFGDALTAVLEGRGHEVVGAGTETVDPVNVVQKREIDAVVIDIPVAHAVGVETLATIVETSPATDVVALTEGYDCIVTNEVLAAGARACVDKRAGLADVVDAIERDAINGHIARPSTTGRTGEWTLQSLGEFLTPRERQVLEGLVDGDSTARLATRLGVGVATARTHVQNVLSKLGVHSRLHAVLFAVEHGLVAVPPTVEQRSA